MNQNTENATENATEAAPEKSEVKEIKLKDLKAAPKNQPRAEYNEEALADYKTLVKVALANKTKPGFGHLIAYRDTFGGDIFLSDGFHRRQALLANKVEKFDVLIIDSDDAERDALKNGFRANIRHGARLTNADKKHNLERALEDKEWSKFNNVQLAELIGVSEFFVRSNRSEESKPTKIKTKAGVEIDTTNIGKKTGEERVKKAKAKKAAKKASKPADAEPRVDAPLEKAYAKISKALGDKGPRTVEAVQKGIIAHLSRADIIKLSMNSDVRVRELGELVFTSRWKLKTAIKFLDKVVDGNSRVADLINRAITGGGFYRDRIEKNTVIVVRDDWGTVGEKDGVTFVTPKKKK